MALINFGVCGCCSGNGCDCNCCIGIGYWTDYTFTVAGITDGGSCSQCPDLNGTWTLTRNGSCQWTTENPPSWSCTATGPYWVLTCSGGVFSLSNMIDGSTPGYTLTGTAICSSGGTLTKTGSDGLCTNYPGSISISSSGTFLSCSCQEIFDQLPTTIYLTFTYGFGCFVEGVTIAFTKDVVNDWYEFTGTIGSCADEFVLRIYCENEGDTDMTLEIVSQGGSPDGSKYSIGIDTFDPFYGTFSSGTATIGCSSPPDFCLFGGTVQE